MKDTKSAFLEFFQVLKRLRNPGGCPWDIEQTPMTMRTPLIEEAYEVIDSIEAFEQGEKNALSNLKEELGDVILNAMMIAYMFEQENKFTVADVFSTLTEKLIRRHPHVFGETEGYAGPDSEAKTTTADEVLSQWDHIKESVEKKEVKSILDTIPKAFPPLLRAYKLQKKASKKGFDWQHIDGVKDKISEEINEFKAAVDCGDEKHVLEEFGDVLFSLVNLGRFLKLDPVVALNAANHKFEKRFKYVEEKMLENSFAMCAENIEKAEKFWEEAKSLLP
ncbi:MAG: nucleoside triphosphate pyrophosphohydrolase [Treponema sp.]|nr:MAG: nucleoside triphosphate pyrophosphohydrolase [Treponema sp.]